MTSCDVQIRVAHAAVLHFDQPWSSTGIRRGYRKTLQRTQEKSVLHENLMLILGTYIIWCTWYILHFNIYIKYNWLNQESLNSWNLSEQHIKVAQFSSLELHRFKRTCFIFASHANRLHGASHLAMRWVGWLEESDLWKSSCGFSVMEFGSMKLRKSNYSVLLVAPSRCFRILGSPNYTTWPRVECWGPKRIICSKHGRMHCDLWFRMSKNKNT